MVYNDSDTDTDHASGGQIAVGVVLIFLLLVGLSFNSLVIHAFRVTQRLQTPTNVLIISLVSCDIVVNILVMPFAAASGFYGNWIFGLVWCKGFAFVTSLLRITTMCIITALALERFYVVTRSPIMRKATTFTACMTALSCFGYGLLWATFPLVGWGKFVVDNSKITCGPEWSTRMTSPLSINVTVLVLVFLLPGIVIFYCYIKVTLEMMKNKVMQQRSQTSISDSSERSKEMHVSAAVYLTILVYCMAWIPYIGVQISAMCHPDREFPPSVSIFANVLGKSSSVLNGIVYVSKNKYFRTSLREAVKKPLCWDYESEVEVVLDQPTTHNDIVDM